MSVEYIFTSCLTALSPSRLPGLNYSLNPYTGCEHGCAYCYSPSVFKDQSIAESWGKVVRIKRNIVETLMQEVHRKDRGVVGLSTVTDPYQPVEKNLELTRKCIEVLLEHDFPVSIQTKSDLVLRDSDLIVPKKFDVGVTITTIDPELARLLEPKASPPDARAQVLEEFSGRGVDTWIFLGPIIPEINDDEENLRKIVEIAAKTKSKVLYDKLNLKPWVMERLEPVLESLKPGLAGRIPPTISHGHDYQKIISSKIIPLCRELGIKCEAAFASGAAGGD
ncbi:MAG: SPL family radical SAM protein [Candidatus Hadarchaeum sp.]|uniref:SPL family radical SAM protein n=1 Tax=Candidatus Hadarchaeum sp. TaxID=2883567 RepID=UPI003D11BAE7